MKRFIMLLIGPLFLHSCLSGDSQPICSTLQNIVDSFIINHPNGDVIMIHVDRVFTILITELMIGIIN